jgi:hypothetical protein
VIFIQAENFLRTNHICTLFYLQTALFFHRILEYLEQTAPIISLIGFIKSKRREALLPILFQLNQVHINNNNTSTI